MNLSAGITTTSAREALEKLRARGQEARKKALTEAILTAEAQARIEAPVDTGNLMRSISSSVNAEGTEATLRTNGVSYAPAVHERLGAYHPKPGSKAKFIEDPIRAAGEKLPEIAARHLRGEGG
jgi:hypothetical protein